MICRYSGKECDKDIVCEVCGVYGNFWYNDDLYDDYAEDTYEQEAD